MTENLSPFENYEKAPNTFWEENKRTVKDKIKAIFLEYEKGYNLDEIDDEVNRTVEKEEKFTTNIIEAFEKIKKNSQEKIILFDIDETIGKIKAIDERQNKTVLRPSFELLLENYFNKYLEKKELKIGFLSSRSKDSICNQLDDINHLVSIKKYVDKDYIYSTRDVKTTDDPENYDYRNNPAINPILYKDRLYELYPGDLQKLEYIKNNLPSLEGKSIMIVDDFKYTDVLNSDKKLYGVCVQDFIF